MWQRLLSDLLDPLLMRLIDELGRRAFATRESAE